MKINNLTTREQHLNFRTVNPYCKFIFVMTPEPPLRTTPKIVTPRRRRTWKVRTRRGIRWSQTGHLSSPLRHWGEYGRRGSTRHVQPTLKVVSSGRRRTWVVNPCRGTRRPFVCLPPSPLRWVWVKRIYPSWATEPTTDSHPQGGRLVTLPTLWVQTLGVSLTSYEGGSPGQTLTMPDRRLVSGKGSLGMSGRVDCVFYTHPTVPNLLRGGYGSLSELVPQ